MITYNSEDAQLCWNIEVPNWTNALGNSFECIFIFVPFSHACAVGAIPTTSSAASDPWTVPAFSAKAPSPTTTTPIAAGERTATNLLQEEESHVTYPAAILPNDCTHFHTNTYLSGSKCLTTDIIPAEMDSELESRGTAGFDYVRQQTSQTNKLLIFPHSWSEEKKGTKEVEPVNRMHSVGSSARYSCKRHRDWDGYAKLQEGNSRPSAVRGNDGRCARAVTGSSMENRKADVSNDSFSTPGTCAAFAHPRHTSQ